MDRTELYIADELALAGTLAEIVPISCIDDFVLPEERPVLTKVSERFWDAVRGIVPHPSVDISIVRSKPSARNDLP